MKIVNFFMKKVWIINKKSLYLCKEIKKEIMLSERQIKVINEDLLSMSYDEYLTIARSWNYKPGSRMDREIKLKIAYVTSLKREKLLEELCKEQ